MPTYNIAIPQHIDSDTKRALVRKALYLAAEYRKLSLTDVRACFEAALTMCDALHRQQEWTRLTHEDTAKN